MNLASFFIAVLAAATLPVHQTSQASALSSHLLVGGLSDPLNMVDRTSDCNVIQGEHNNVQHLKIEIPKDTKANVCIMVIGHSDDAGLIVQRYAITPSDKVFVDIIPKPYKGTRTNPLYKPHSISMANVSKQAINLTGEMGWLPSEEIAFSLSTNTADHDRTMVLFYDMTESGTFIGSVGVTTTDAVNKKDIAN